MNDATLAAVLRDPGGPRVKFSSPQDLARAAAMVRLAGELLEAKGWRALHVTGDWQPGPPSANLEPGGGWRHEPVTHVDGSVEVVTIPSDSTGEHALKPDPLAGDHDRYRAALSSLFDAADEVIYFLRKTNPTVVVLEAGDLSPAQVSAAGWCTSCWRDGGYHEPVAVRPNGLRRYRDFCLWCGEFAAAHAQNPPPLPLVEARHRGQRITAGMVDAAVAAEETERKARRKARKKGKRAA